MKCLFLFIPCFFLLVLSSAGQSNNNQDHVPFTGKLILGINGTQIDGDDLSGFNKPGLLAGGALNIGLGSKSGLQLELLYTQRGSQPSKQERAGYGQIVWNVQYISIPVFFNYELVDKFYLKLGLSFNPLLRSSRKYGSADPIINTADFRSLDVSTFFGVAYQFTPEWEVSFRHSYSIFPINHVALNEIRGIQRFASGDAYHNVLSFYVSYILNP